MNKTGGAIFAISAGILIGCTGTATEVRQHAPLATRSGTAYRGVTVAVLPFGGPNGPVARDAVIRVLAEQEGANVVSPSVVDGFLWNGKLQPSAYDQGARLGNPRNPAEAAAKGREEIMASADRFAAEMAPIIAGIRAAGITTLGGIADDCVDRWCRA